MSDFDPGLYEGAPLSDLPYRGPLFTAREHRLIARIRELESQLGISHTQIEGQQALL